MNWEAFGSIAEALGAAGVIVTLIYLVGQVRTGNQMRRSESIRTSHELTVQIGLKIAESRDLAELFQKGVRDPDLLDGPDRGRFTWLMASLVSQEHQSFIDGQLGLLMEEDASDLQQSYAGVLDTPGGRWWWTRNRSRYLAAFVERVDREVFAD